MSTHTQSLPTARIPAGLVRALSFCLLLLMGGCQILPLKQGPTEPLIENSWSDHLKHLSELQDWRIQGKIGYVGKKDSGSAYIDWIQSRDSFHITLTGPLGQGTTIISGNAQGARLESNKDGTFFANSPEELLLEHTGFALPVSQMYLWIKGMPSSVSDEKVVIGERYTLQQLQQGKWTIDYADYQPNLGNMLPSRIKIKGTDVKITLAIKEWELLPEDK